MYMYIYIYTYTCIQMYACITKITEFTEDTSTSNPTQFHIDNIPKV